MRRLTLPRQDVGKNQDIVVRTEIFIDFETSFETGSTDAQLHRNRGNSQFEHERSSFYDHVYDLSNGVYPVREESFNINLTFIIINPSRIGLSVNSHSTNVC